MHAAQATVSIDRNPNEVWAYVADITKTNVWRPDVVSAEWENEEHKSEGAQFRATTNVLGKRMKFLCIVTRYDPPQTFGYRVVEGPARIEVEYAVDGVTDGSSRFTMSASGTSQGPILRLLEPLIARSLSNKMRANVEKLKTVLELEPQR